MFLGKNMPGLLSLIIDPPKISKIHPAYDFAPIFITTLFKIVTLIRGETLLELRGRTIHTEYRKNIFPEVLSIKRTETSVS